MNLKFEFIYAVSDTKNIRETRAQHTATTVDKKNFCDKTECVLLINQSATNEDVQTFDS